MTGLPVCKDLLDRNRVPQVGGPSILEYSIPAGDLDELNANIDATIDVVGEYR